MKSYRTTWMLLLLLATGSATAQQDLTGTWAGALAVAPDTTLNVHFVLTRQGDGSYSAVLTSPDPDGVKDVPVDSVDVDGNRLTMTVDALSGAYEGTLADGTIAGEWRQQGTSIPLSLTPYEAPVMTQAQIDALTGSWVGSLEVPGLGGLTIVFRFETDDAGELTGFLDSPDQGANGIPIADIQMVDDELSFGIPRIRGTYKGTLTGDAIAGEFSQGQAMPLTVNRGEYQAPDAAAGLSDADKARLEGSWVGKVASPVGELTLVFRFETDEEGRFAGFLDSPDQGASGIPVTEIAVADGRVSFRVPAAQVEYSAALTDTEMDGTWRQAGQEQPVMLEKGEYVPGAAALELSGSDMELLAGAWTGELGPLTVTIRFETDADGIAVAFLDVPAQGATDIPVSSATFADGELTLAIAAAGARYTATVAGEEMTGTWTQGPTSNPLTLARQ